jgi:hypothetical protein
MAESEELQLIPLIRGNTVRELLTFTIDVADLNNPDIIIKEPLDLRTYTNIYMDVRVSPKESSELIFRLSLDSGISIMGDDFNKLFIFISKSNSKLFKGQSTQFDEIINNNIGTNIVKYYYRDICFETNDELVTMLKGRYKVIHNISNSTEE